jgi:predicted AAA+ superfamily ATPase
MAKFDPRALTALAERALHLFPVVVITGARQVGKNTLVRPSPELAGRR